MTVRHGADAPFAARRASVAPSHVCRRPGFIQKDQLHDIQRRLRGLPLTPCGLHVGAPCSLACRVFFKREFPFVELMPQRGHFDRNPVFRQSCAYLRERQISCFLQPARSVGSIPTNRDRRWPPIGRLPRWPVCVSRFRT